MFSFFPKRAIFRSDRTCYSIVIFSGLLLVKCYKYINLLAAKQLETNWLRLFLELCKLWCFTTWYACDYIRTLCGTNPLPSSHPGGRFSPAFPVHGLCTPWRAASRYLGEEMKSQDLTFSGTEVPPAKWGLAWHVPCPVTATGLPGPALGVERVASSWARPVGSGSLHESSCWAKMLCENLALLSWKLRGASHKC